MDINPEWPRCNQVGTVVSVRKNKVIWKSHTDGEIVEDKPSDMIRVR